MRIDPFYSLYEPSVSDVAARLALFMRAMAAGPATDAQRDGLPVRVIDGGVAVVPITGAMLRGVGRYASAFGMTDTDSARLAIQAADNDPEVNNILLRVDSPGGSVSGLDQLADTIANARTPVTAVVDGMAASAAYWVASQADRVVMGRNDLVGSIGVRVMLYDFSAAFEREGIKAIPVDTGEYKSAGAMGTKITEAQVDDFKRVVDSLFADFVATVSRGRKMTEEQVRAVGDGRVFTVREAVNHGLVDGMATYQETLASLKASRQRRTSTARARVDLV